MPKIDRLRTEFYFKLYSIFPKRKEHLAGVRDMEGMRKTLLLFAPSRLV
tara:strand:- start:726 stop:872 length:147 start_codon:yes stop_codon:yes gene_type:complete